MKNVAAFKSGIDCKNIFKNKENVKSSLNILWAKIINHLENNSKSMYNGTCRTMLTHQIGKDEVSNE